MPSLNFQKQFVPLIESGKKRQTIRLVRKKNLIKPGDRLYLFTGLRTKKCERIFVNNAWYNKGPFVICKSVDNIEIRLRDIYINGKELMGCDKFSLAYKDGFENYTDFYFFFKKQYGLPFQGVVIKW